jgi:hypothetical protein
LISSKSIRPWPVSGVLARHGGHDRKAVLFNDLLHALNDWNTIVQYDKHENRNDVKTTLQVTKHVPVSDKHQAEEGLADGLCAPDRADNLCIFDSLSYCECGWSGTCRNRLAITVIKGRTKTKGTGGRALHFLDKECSVGEMFHKPEFQVGTGDVGAMELSGRADKDCVGPASSTPHGHISADARTTP